MISIKQRLREAHARDLRVSIEGHYDSNPIYTDALTEIERFEEVYRREREAHAANLKEWQKCEAELKQLKADAPVYEDMRRAISSQLDTIRQLRADYSRLLDTARVGWGRIEEAQKCLKTAFGGQTDEGAADETKGDS